MNILENNSCYIIFVVATTSFGVENGQPISLERLKECKIRYLRRFWSTEIVH